MSAHARPCFVPSGLCDTSSPDLSLSHLRKKRVTSCARARWSGLGILEAARDDRHGLVPDFVGAFQEMLYALFGLGAECLVANRCNVDRAVQAGPSDRGLGEEDRDGGIRDGAAISFLHRGFGQLERLDASLHRLEWYFRRLSIGALHRLDPRGLFRLRGFRQPHRLHHGVVRLRVLVDERLEAGLSLLRPGLELREFGLHALVPFLAAREAGHHPTQRDRQGARERRDASAARRRRRCGDGGEELLQGAVLHSHRRVSRICSRWNRASFKYWVAASTSASRGTRPMISLSAISTPSFAARARTASNACASEVLR